ncbi:MAG: hypothetical protein AVDCRST_MAG87-1749 [uncultured Thermomicrobiales bacterium]|uniref:Uncharacterized protein n=1 Tax=uncultured Thermomicrobiales bacterium TaxID=1645740 RepID=A0A6J4UXK0_9BACT|nr:MAG: hypothetical protein AVDCRST_MAG87-1749 [uncultured Thermomicrobiales bacterium]
MRLLQDGPPPGDPRRQGRGRARDGVNSRYVGATFLRTVKPGAERVKRLGQVPQSSVTTP